jgi:UDP-N-acetylglucosamine 2-epimerase (non-hydrolysing)/GDP/UDP-N,N'-diacetylbacillosamine 2-epimerase (hydrolysing)
MKKILGITGIRSDYDLMSCLYRRLTREPGIDCRLLVGGAHLSKTYGHSIDLIEADEIPILAAIESLIDGDTRTSRLKSASILLQGAIDVVTNWDPDLVLYAGDREEVWIGGVLGAYLGIPTVHFYGGDQISTGHVDNAVRHAASKLSTHHAVALEEHRLRLIAMGEAPERISVIGSLSLDNFVAQQGPPMEELRKKLALPAALREYALVLFHPEPTEAAAAPAIVRIILEELRAAGLGACVGYPNTDPANKSIIRTLEEFRGVAEFFFYKNLAREDFISLYKAARFIIGNSSSGIIEAASIPIPAISVGARQRGRHAGGNVIFTTTDREAIRAAIAAAQAADFRLSIQGMSNPYGDGHSCQRALDMLLGIDFRRVMLKVEDPLHGESIGTP